MELVVVVSSRVGSGSATQDLNVTLHTVGKHNTASYNRSGFITGQIGDRLLLMPNIKAFSGNIDMGPRN